MPFVAATEVGLRGDVSKHCVVAAAAVAVAVVAVVAMCPCGGLGGGGGVVVVNRLGDRAAAAGYISAFVNARVWCVL